MEDLMELTYGLPAILILLFSAAVIIFAMHALFVFTHVISHLACRLIKFVDKQFKEK